MQLSIPWHTFPFSVVERNNGLTVHKICNQFFMGFDSDHQTGEFYNEALSAWYYARVKFLENDNNDEDEALRTYYLWTLEYPFSIMKEEESLSNKIKEMYAEQIASEKKNISIKTGADLIKIFEDMSLAKVDYIVNENKMFSAFCQVCSRIRIPHQSLLELNPKSKTAYARFIATIDYLLDLNQDIEIQTNSYDNISYDDYNIIGASMAPALLGTVRDMHEHIKKGTFDDSDYQIEYQADLKQFNVPIEDLINRVALRIMNKIWRTANQILVSRFPFLIFFEFLLYFTS